MSSSNEPAPSPLASAPPATVAHERLRAVSEVILCSGVPTQLLLQAMLMGTGVVDAPDGRLSISAVVAVLLMDTVIVVVLMTLLTRARGESVRELWLGDRPLVPEAVYGALLIAPVFLTVVVLLNVLRLVAPWLHNVPENPLEQLAGASHLNAAAFAVAAIIGGGIREELQRAFLLRRFERHLGGPIVGVVVLGIAFGLGHYVQGWDAVITTGVLGVFWSVIYLRRRSSVAPIVSHAGYNSLEVLLVAVARA